MTKRPKFKVGDTVYVAGNLGNSTVTGVVYAYGRYFYNVKPTNRRGGRLPKEYFSISETAIKKI